MLKRLFITKTFRLRWALFKAGLGTSYGWSLFVSKIRSVFRYIRFRVDLWAFERVQAVYRAGDLDPMSLFFSHLLNDYLSNTGAENGIVKKYKGQRDVILTIRYAGGKTLEEMYLSKCEELKITDTILNDRSEVLKAIPECERHGNECIPHAIDWILESKKIREDYQQLENSADRMEAGLQAIDQWAKAYPLVVFPEPGEGDLKRAEELLLAGGISYTALNAYAMRHVIEGVKNLVKDALAIDENLQKREGKIEFNKGAHISVNSVDSAGWAEINFNDLAHPFDYEKFLKDTSAIQGVPAHVLGIDQGSAEGDRSVSSVICGNCGVYRRVSEAGFIVEDCPNCGDDEYDLYSSEDIP